VLVCAWVKSDVLEEWRRDRFDVFGRALRELIKSSLQNRIYIILVVDYGCAMSTITGDVIEYC
jgi:hypothetical protein